MPSSTEEDAIAIYWDLDFPPTCNPSAPLNASAVVAACLALARAFGPVGLQRALGGPQAPAGCVAAHLKRRGIEHLLVLPSACGADVRPLAGMIECVAQDLMLRPNLRRLVLLSSRHDLAAVTDFVASCGRQVVVLRGPAVRHGMAAALPPHKRLAVA